MSMKSKQNRSSYHGGRHARKKTRKNIAVGPKNFVDKSEDTFFAQRQQAAYMMMQQPQQRRRSSKKPPPKPRRLYLEKKLSASPSPPGSPDISDFELIPAVKKKSPPRPPPPKSKGIASSPGLKDNRKVMMLANSKEDMIARRSVSPDKRQPPLPKPRNGRQQDASNDVNIDELKSKLQALQPPASCSTGSPVLKLSPPRPVVKSSPPPLTQRAVQAKLQPMLPPTARPRKTKTESSSLSDDLTSLDAGVRGDRNRQVGGAQNEIVKSCDDILIRKKKPLPKVPLPVPRSRLKSNKEEENTLVQKSPSHSRPIPVPKSRNFSESRDQRISYSKHEEVELNKIPVRPVPRARVVSKESKEQVLGNTDSSMAQNDKRLKTIERESSNNVAKPPVPRKRGLKENLTEVPDKELPPIPSGHSVAAFSATPASKRGSIGYSGDKTGRSKRKKGGGIRTPLWKAPPPPDFTPPSTPRNSMSHKKPPPPISQVSATPNSATPISAPSKFILPPFQQSPMVTPVENVSPSILVMPNSPSNHTPPKEPIQLAKTPVSSPRISSDVEFEENLYENKSVKRKRRIPSGPNALPLSIVQELQSNFRVQARR